MFPRMESWITVDEEGRVVLPQEMAEEFGICPGVQMLVQKDPRGLHLQRPITQLAKVYVELTSRCNLNCTTCIRNSWDEFQGDMSSDMWERVVGSLQGLPSRPDVFFGGFGEPLLIADIAEKVKQVKPLARKVELITNGILLTKERSRELINSGLDMLWVSLDGATPESYSDVRLGATLPKVLENIERLSYMRHDTARMPEIGIAFVAMKKNIADLPALIHMGPKLGISQYMVTNVFPYTEEMCKEMLYIRSMDEWIQPLLLLHQELTCPGSTWMRAPKKQSFSRSGTVRTCFGTELLSDRTVGDARSSRKAWSAFAGMARSAPAWP